ncbi:MAG: M16 family metallopeptidase, partial [Gemmatimonadaceae bacterium]
MYRTSRGVPVLVRRKPGAPMTRVGVFMQGGAVDEAAAMSGLTMLMTRTAVKGTETRSAEEIAETAERLGGTISPIAGGETFGWSISVPAARYDDALALLADVAQHATHPEGALATERDAAISEVIALRDDMFRYPMQLALAAAFPSHPYGRSPGGSEASLRAVTVESVRDWYATRVLHSTAVVGIVGDADPDALADAAARAFGELTYAEHAFPKAPRWPNRIATAIEARDKAQTALLMLFPSPTRLNYERYAAGLVAGIASGLGGRFFDELRERQSLAYTVHAFASERRLAGAFGAYIAMSPDQEDVARAGLLTEFQKLREAPVTAEELAHVQAYAVGAHAIRQQRGSAVLDDVITAWTD